MVLKARINNDRTYNLVRWSASDFNSSLTLTIQSIDLADIKNVFRNIDLLEIFQDDVPIATYTYLDTFSQMTYLGTVFVEGENKFADAMSITLTKTDIVNQVQRLDEQINKVVDLDSMTVSELRDYKLGEISKAAEQDVYDGETIELSDGTRQKFTYDAHDQTNWDELFMLCLIAPEMELLPYHGNQNFCAFFTRERVVQICSTLMLRKTRIVTYANALNMYIRSLTDRASIMSVEYGMELPQDYEDRIAGIMAGTITQMQKFLERISREISPTEDQTEDPTDIDPEEANNNTASDPIETEEPVEPTETEPTNEE